MTSAPIVKNCAATRKRIIFCDLTTYNAKEHSMNSTASACNKAPSNPRTLPLLKLINPSTRKNTVAAAPETQQKHQPQAQLSLRQISGHTPSGTNGFSRDLRLSLVMKRSLRLGGGGISSSAIITATSLISASPGSDVRVSSLACSFCQDFCIAAISN